MVRDDFVTSFKKKLLVIVWQDIFLTCIPSIDLYQFSRRNVVANSPVKIVLSPPINILKSQAASPVKPELLWIRIRPGPGKNPGANPGVSPAVKGGN